MTTMKNRERMRGYQAHNDLLSQVADSREERDNVRRILGGLTERDLDAQEAWKRAPFAHGPANHAHRYSACQSGPCAGGRKPCPSAEACQMAAADPPRPPMRGGDLLCLIALALAGWGAIALTLLAMGFGRG